jgi:hypothetical protein
VDRSKPQKKPTKSTVSSPSKVAVVVEFGGDSDDDKSIDNFSVGDFDFDDQDEPMDIDAAQSESNAGNSGKPKATGARKRVPSVATAASLSFAAP